MSDRKSTEALIAAMRSWATRIDATQHSTIDERRTAAQMWEWAAYLEAKARLIEVRWSDMAPEEPNR
jgi:hypothetical protein